MRGLKDLLIESGITFDGEKIQLPSWCRRVKIDVGLSYNAPQTSHWISVDRNLIVFGFEPISENLIRLKKKFSLNQGGLENATANKQQLFIVPIALGNVSEPGTIPMYVTEHDTGCSSTLEPRDFKVKKTEIVPIFALAHFFDLFPFDSIAYIDHVKTDVQGADADVVRGIGKYISKILAITSEIETNQYVHSHNSLEVIEEILKSEDFTSILSKRATQLKLIQYVEDPTWINANRYQKSNRRDLYLFQKG
jgi:FkbM family methyltransferase